MSFTSQQGVKVPATKCLILLDFVASGKCGVRRDFEAKGSRKINPKILISIFDRLVRR